MLKLHMAARWKALAQKTGPLTPLDLLSSNLIGNVILSDHWHGEACERWLHDLGSRPNHSPDPFHLHSALCPGQLLKYSFLLSSSTTSFSWSLWPLQYQGSHWLWERQWRLFFTYTDASLFLPQVARGITYLPAALIKAEHNLDFYTWGLSLLLHYLFVFPLK